MPSHFKMKIFYCIRSLAHVPSCMYNVRMLTDLQYQVVPVVGLSSPSLNQVMEKLGLRFYSTIMDLSSNRLIKTLQLNAVYKKNLRSAFQEYKPGDLVIFGTADSAVYASSKYRKDKFILCLKEMHEQDWVYPHMLKKVARRADGVICCEKNRARYAQFVWDLPKRPFVISNKPYGYSTEPNVAPSCRETENVIRQMRGKKAIIYQARHIHFVDELLALVRALKELNEDLLLVLVGNIDRPYDLEELTRIYPNVLSAGHIPAPKHLEITSYAKIGIALYAENSLNNLFCAPNKIYEYAGFGIPSLCNDVPGLVETIGLNQAGVCVDWSDVQSICKGLRQVLQQYDYYSKNALKLFNSENNLTTIEYIVETILREND